VYAAALENGRIVLSSRETGATEGGFIEVQDAGGTLVEVEKTAKEGKDAEFSVDGVAGTASSNTVTTAIPGVTLTLQGITSSGPVTIDVQPPSANVANLEEKVKAFITAYNSTVEAIHTQLTTKPLEKPEGQSQFGTGTLFNDLELQGLLNSMREIMYEPIAGLEASLSSMSAIGVSTGAATGGASSKGSLEGTLKLEPAKLAEAIKANPTGVREMVQQWSQKLQSAVSTVGGPGGGLAARALQDAGQITELQRQITNMNELLAQKEKALQQTYAKLEAAISQSSAQSSWLARQTESLFSSGG
jgi:flagellar hook-associated protein 2